MKISRIAEALGSISDEISREAVEEIEAKSDGVSDNVSAQKPRIVRSEAPRKAPFIIAAASLCAAAAIAFPIYFSALENKNIVNSGAAECDSASVPEAEFLFSLRDNNDLWYETRKFTVPEYESVEFLWTTDGVRADGQTLIWGTPVWSVYLADLNGDGKREIVSEFSIGSGIINQGICACDFSEKKLYMLQLQNPIPSECSLFINNGELWVREKKYCDDEVTNERKLSLSEMSGYDLNAEKGPDVYYGETEIPVVSDVSSDEIIANSIEKMVFETKTIGDYTVKLVGSHVYKRGDKEKFSDVICANQLHAYIEKDGKFIDKAELDVENFVSDTITDEADGANEYRLFKDKIGSYLSVYDLEYPVIALSFWFDDAINPRMVKNTVSFAAIKDDYLITQVEMLADVGTAAQNVKDICDDYPYDSLRPNINSGFYSTALSSGEQLQIVNKTTLVDENAGIKFSFGFNRDYVLQIEASKLP